MQDDLKPMTIVIQAEQVDKYEEQCRVILEEIGHPEALITDLSQVGDFTMLWEVEDEQYLYERLSTLAGMHVSGQTYIWHIAKHLKKD